MSPDLVSGLTAKERRQVSDMAECAQVSAEDMALALLQAHLILIRDCVDVLPGDPKATARDRAIRLGSGRNVS